MMLLYYKSIKTNKEYEYETNGRLSASKRSKARKN